MAENRKVAGITWMVWSSAKPDYEPELGLGPQYLG